jgi:hypothetical protein
MVHWVHVPYILFTLVLPFMTLFPSFKVNSGIIRTRIGILLISNLLRHQYLYLDNHQCLEPRSIEKILIEWETYAK